MADIIVPMGAPGASQASRETTAFATSIRDLAKAEDEHIARLHSSEQRLRSFDQLQRRLAEGAKQAAAAVREQAKAHYEVIRRPEWTQKGGILDESGGGGGRAGGFGGLLRAGLGRIAPGLGALAGVGGSLAVGVGSLAIAYRTLAKIGDREVEEAGATLTARIALRHAIEEGVKSANAAASGQFDKERKSLRLVAAFGQRGDDKLAGQLNTQGYRGTAGAVAQTLGMGQSEQRKALDAAKALADAMDIPLDEAMGMVAKNGHLMGGKTPFDIAARALRQSNPGLRIKGDDLARGIKRVPGSLRTPGRLEANLEANRRGRGVTAKSEELHDSLRKEASPESAAKLDFFKAQSEKIEVLTAQEKAASALVEGFRRMRDIESTQYHKLNTALSEGVGGDR